MPIPTDPLLADQWHLSNPGPGLLDLNVFDVWNPFEGPAYTGAGTRTFVIDNGFDYNHGDLAPNYNLALDFDFETNTIDAFGGPFDSHGTAVMGIIGAAANGFGTVGIAHETNLVGYRTANLISDAWLQDVRDAIAAAGDPNRFGDVMNISQGIANDTTSEFGSGYNAVRFDEIENSIGIAVDTGRGGLGVTIVKSAGNSRAANYDVNADDWTNDTRQVVVAAVDQDGFVSNYSSYGAAVLVSGFGTPGQVVTTDRVGADGYDPTDFTRNFNGTSAAAPMVSGVVALMYEANPDLGWRDVQDILGASARHVGTDVGAGIAGSERYAWQVNGATTWNGGGQHHSNDYGYGLVDALAAVRMAETWLSTGAVARTSANQFINNMDVLDVATIVPDNSTLEFTGNAFFNDIVERVTVEMEFDTTFVGDLRVYLISPDGTESELIRNNGGGTDFNGTWTFESQAFRGERAAGDWTVRVTDSLGGDTLTVQDIVIRTFGASTTDDRYVFTNEYSDFAFAGLGYDTVITDTNGGTDTVNASAVTGNSNIRLNGTLGVIDNVQVRLNNMENAIGGDGNDIVHGNNSNNRLIGMRGNDTLTGLSGFDTMNGGTGNDSMSGGGLADVMFGEDGNDSLNGDGGSDFMSGGNGFDTMDGGEGNDRMSGGALADQMSGNFGDDEMFGDGGSDIMFAGVGFDTMDGGSGNDRMYGGAQADLMRGGGDNDSLEGMNGNDFLFGGNGFDTLLGGSGGDGLYGGNQADLLRGGTGNDLLQGQNGSDFLFGDSDFDTLLGGAGNDQLFGGTHGDLLRGGADNDTLYGQGGSDFLFGDSGFDTLTGGEGNDSIYGGTQSDLLQGNQGDDWLFGEAGRDFLIGGVDDDRLAGGANGDVFIFSGQFGNDRIVDFDSSDASEDIDLSGVSTIVSFADLQANHMSQTGSAVLIQDGLGNSIQVQNVTLASMDISNFIF